MILVEGDYCPDAEQVCLRWIDPPPYENLRCAEYAKPAKCKVPKVHKRFCIDREEYAARDANGDLELPMVRKNWNEAQAICATRSARLCRETEWEFACEGPDLSPYPYGWKRDSTICNFDKTNLGGPEEKLNDLRAPLSAYPDCKSPFGVHDMVGNVDEWVEREGMQAPNRSALRGGWWLPGRNRCRAATLHHGEEYSAKQVGFRCCKEAPDAAP
jgi:formylglycine-generating enzyme required for sulfatase activity